MYHRRLLTSNCPSDVVQVAELYYAGVPQDLATVAQLVEQLICNQPVGGSSPSGGSYCFE